MAKNTLNTSFRNIDVDVHNEEIFGDDADVETAYVGPNESAINNLLHNNRLSEALQACLKNPPFRSKSQESKDKCTQLVIRVLCSFKQSEVQKAVNNLDVDQLDILMKYIYKGFEFGQDGSSPALLFWHKIVFAKAGDGAIMRAVLALSVFGAEIKKIVGIMFDLTALFPQEIRPYNTRYRCFSVAMCPSTISIERTRNIDYGGKGTALYVLKNLICIILVLLPHSALDWLTRLHISYPMLFKITNTNKEVKRSTHCGVLEFHQEEGKCYIPHWMMRNLLLCEGDMIQIESVDLPVGSYVKLKPQDSRFVGLANPSVLLELKLRNYACLTKGDMIAIEYNDKVMEFLVQELRPSDAVSIIECDINVRLSVKLTCFTDGYLEINFRWISMFQKISQNRPLLQQHFVYRQVLILSFFIIIKYLQLKFRLRLCLRWKIQQYAFPGKAFRLDGKERPHKQSRFSLTTDADVTTVSELSNFCIITFFFDFVSFYLFRYDADCNFDYNKLRFYRPSAEQKDKRDGITSGGKLFKGDGHSLK
ncbi:Ubiquitin fusion degradation protein 1 -like protein [Trichinella pseudospiralis]|uniref:Arp2/3 complex 16 kDa subunit n=1 Tax=Trichinella pseudospiralis TaxID=6337 RepID=A0A0V1J6A6_TRIPS|nr:Ubiquitin fusion degradation protein 1 -like protein [Trichinella pseudospiralis]KRZ42739.1 Ubiquitin fusion degradation protein 1 -like protein [Trichinella pseudospiralis]